MEKNTSIHVNQILILLFLGFDSMAVYIVNLKFYKGPHEYCGRPSVLGNPYSHKPGTLAKFKVNSVDEAVESYDSYIRNEIENGNIEIINELKRLRDIKNSEANLILGCWCFPFTRCHCEVIESIISENIL